MLYRPFSFQTVRRAFAVGTIAALAFAPGNSFGQDTKATPVSSTFEGVTASTNCKEWKPGELMASEKCEILKGQFLSAQRNALDAQAKALNAQGQSIAAQNGCIDQLVQFKKADPDGFKALAFGNITRENACNFASRLPKKSASLN